MVADFYDINTVALTDEGVQKPSAANIFPTSDIVHTIGELGNISQCLPKRQYVELNKDIAVLLNQD
ncbi:hypothetical protein PS15p_210234 [Mucor circinelloides]